MFNVTISSCQLCLLLRALEKEDLLLSGHDDKEEVSCIMVTRAACVADVYIALQPEFLSAG